MSPDSTARASEEPPRESPGAARSERSPAARARRVASRPRRAHLELDPVDPASLDAEDPVAVVSARLRETLVAAFDGDGPAHGAVNVLRWGRPLWTDDPTALSPVALRRPDGSVDGPSSLVVETGPNAVRTLRAHETDPDATPDDAAVVSVDRADPDVARRLVALVETGEVRAPAVSRTYRRLAGDRPVPPDGRQTLCFLDDGDARYRVECPPQESRLQPMHYLLARTGAAAAGHDVTLAVPSLSPATTRPFRRAIRDGSGAADARSFPDPVHDLARSFDHVLTPSGVYGFEVARR